MSKAFKCNNCLELFEGDPAIHNGIIDICDNCVRVAKIFNKNKVDPFNDQFHEKQNPDNTLDIGNGFLIVPR